MIFLIFGNEIKKVDNSSMKNQNNIKNIFSFEIRKQ